MLLFYSRKQQSKAFFVFDPLLSGHVRQEDNQQKKQT